MAQQLTGGTQSAPNRAPAAKVLAGAIANERVAASLITNLGNWMIPAAIVATNVSTTVDFGSLTIGDLVIHVSATDPAAYTQAAQTYFGTVTVTGTLPTVFTAAVVGDLYVVLRAVNLDGNNPIVPAGAQLTGRQTGHGGTDF